MRLQTTILRNFKKAGSWFPWDEVLNQIKNKKILKAEMVYTHQEMLVPILGNILEKTPKRIQANYMMLRFIEWNLEEISEEYLKRMRNEFDSEVWCAKNSRDLFLIPMISQYLKRYSITAHQDNIVNSKIVENLKTQYVKAMKKVLNLVIVCEI